MGYEDRAAYLRRRFGGLQAILNRREREFVAELLARIDPPPRRILDIPSGRGRFTPLLRSAASERLVCCDIDPRRIQALSDAEGEEGAPITLRIADLFERLPFGDGEFDLVFNFRFLHHVRDLARLAHVASELVRVSQRHLIVSYYGLSLVHGVQRRLWRAVPGHRSNVELASRRRMHALFAGQGCRLVVDRAMLPVLHAHHVMYLHKSEARRAVAATP
jgi:SAM-dependent methyltransferase